MTSFKWQCRFGKCLWRHLLATPSFHLSDSHRKNIWRHLLVTPIKYETIHTYVWHSFLENKYTWRHFLDSKYVCRYLRDGKYVWRHLLDGKSVWRHLPVEMMVWRFNGRRNGIRSEVISDDLKKCRQINFNSFAFKNLSLIIQLNWNDLVLKNVNLIETVYKAFSKCKLNGNGLAFSKCKPVSILCHHVSPKGSSSLFAKQVSRHPEKNDMQSNFSTINDHPRNLKIVAGAVVLCYKNRKLDLIIVVV